MNSHDFQGYLNILYFIVASQIMVAVAALWMAEKGLQRNDKLNETNRRLISAQSDNDIQHFKELDEIRRNCNRSVSAAQNEAVELVSRANERNKQAVHELEKAQAAMIAMVAPEGRDEAEIEKHDDNAYQMTVDSVGSIALFLANNPFNGLNDEKPAS